MDTLPYWLLMTTLLLVMVASALALGVSLHIAIHGDYKLRWLSVIWVLMATLVLTGSFSYTWMFWRVGPEKFSVFYLENLIVEDR